MSKFLNVNTMAYYRMEKRRQAMADKDTGLYGDAASLDGKGIKEYDNTDAFSQGDVIIKDGDFWEANGNIPANATFIEGVTGASWQRLSAEAVVSIEEYQNNKAYVENEAVVRSGRLYRSRSTFTPSTWNEAEWDAIDAKYAQRAKVPVFSFVETYQAGEMIINNDIVYRARANVAAGNFDVTEWEDISSGKTTLVDDWTAGKVYVLYQLVMRNGLLYRAARTTSTTWVDSEWVEVSSTSLLRGTWVLSETYTAADIVIRDLKLYQANDAIPANTAFTVGTTGATWAEVSATPESNVIKGFVANAVYLQNEVIINSGILYRATSAFTAQAVFDPVNWESISYEPEAVVQAYTTGDNYLAGQLVARSTLGVSRLWRANSNITTAPAVFNEGDWTLLTPEPMFRGGWVLTGAYVANNIVHYNGKLYKANGVIASNTAWAIGSTGATWAALLAEEDVKIAIWEASTSYTEGTLLAHDGNLWRVTSDFTSSSTFSTSGLELLTSGRHAKLFSFQGSYDYVANETIVHQGAIYRANTAFTSTSSLVESDWTKILDTNRPVAPEWDTANGYVLGSLVSYEGELYRSNKVIGSNLAWDATSWDRLGGEKSWRGTYRATSVYALGDIVHYQNKLYTATTAITVAEAFTVAKWNEVSPPANPSAPNWAANTSYAIFDLVIHNGLLYRCQELHTSAPTFDATKWETLKAESTTVVQSYVTGSDYSVNELIEDEGVLYRASEAITNAPATLDINKWQAVSLTTVKVRDHSAAAIYQQREIVWHNGRLYRANKLIDPAAAFSVDDWDAISETNIISTYTVGADYAVGQLFRKNDNLYLVTTEITSAAALIPTASVIHINVRESFRGIHDDTKTYLTNDIVVSGSALYRANKVISANTALDAGEANSNWSRITPSTNTIREYIADVTWVEGELCTYDGSVYRARRTLHTPDTVSSVTFDDSLDWELVGTLRNVVRDYANGLWYAGELCTNNGGLWQNNATKSHTSFIAAEWTQLSSSTTNIPDFVAGSDYVTGEIVSYNNGIYRYAAADATVASWNGANWDRLDERSIWRGLWLLTNAYVQGDYTIHDGRIYEANGIVAANTAFAIGTTGATWTSRGLQNQLVEYTGTAIDVKTGQLVLHKGQLYQAFNDATLPADTWNPGLLPLVGNFQTTRHIFEPSKFYLGSEIIWHEGALYYATMAFQATATFDAANWTLLSYIDASVFNHTEGKVYYVGNLALINGKLSRCIVQHTALASVTVANWVTLGGSGGGIEEWALASAYSQDDLVLHAGNIYQANSNIAANTVFAEGTSANQWRRRIGSQIIEHATGVYVPNNTLVRLNDMLFLSNEAFTCTANAVTDVVTSCIPARGRAPELVLTYPSAMYLAAGTAFRYTGTRVTEATGDDFTSNGITLPSTNLSNLLTLGYRAYLNGVDVTHQWTAATADGTLSGWSFTEFWIQAGDRVVFRVA